MGGASGTSDSRAGRSRVAKEEASNFLAGVGATAGCCSGTDGSVELEAGGVAGGSPGAPGAAAVLAAVDAGTGFCTAGGLAASMGDGRVRSIRTDSVVVLL